MGHPAYKNKNVAEPGCPSRTYHWLKRNWITVALVLVALAGLALALANFLQPCVKEARTRLELVPFVNVTTVDDKLVRLIPLDMHVALDHSGSMDDDFKFGNATMGIVQMWETLNNETLKIAQRKDAVAGSSPELRFALSKWTSDPSQILFNLTDLDSAIAGVDAFDATPKGGTAIGTALARCVLEFMPGNDTTPAPTAAPSVAPTVAPTAPTNATEDDDGTSVVVSDDAGPLNTTQTCLIVTDGVAYDNSNVYEFGKTFATLKEECQTWANEFNRTDELNETAQTQVLKGCGSTIRVPALAEVLLSCARLGLTGTDECTAVNIAAALRARGVVLLGMYVGDGELDVKFGQPFLRNMTSCSDGDYVDTDVDDDCPFFVSSNATEVVPSAIALAAGLLDSFASKTVSRQTVITTRKKILEPKIEYICTGDPLYLIFLMFLIPLAAYLFWRPFTLLMAKYCCPPRYDEPEFVYMDQQPQPVVPFTPEPQVMDDRILQPSWHQPPVAPIPEQNAVQPPRPTPNTIVAKKHYKWSIKKADNYLWNLGAAGVGPMHVNFNGAAPPSAPRLEAKSANMQRRTQRVSMRWSYVPPETRASARASTRISSALYDAVLPNYERASERLEPFQEDEMQPGDLDYEYAMCLMKWFPCLRPRNPPAATNGGGAGQQGQMQQRAREQQNQMQQQTSPRFGRGGSSLAPNNQHNDAWSHQPSDYAPEPYAQSEGGSRPYSEYSQSQYAQSEYAHESYAPSEDFGSRSYSQSQFGQSEYTRGETGSYYAGSDYGDGRQSQYGQSEYSRSNTTNSFYPPSEYSEYGDGSQSQYSRGYSER